MTFFFCQYSPNHLCFYLPNNPIVKPLQPTPTPFYFFYHFPPPVPPVSLHTTSLKERGWESDSHIMPWSLSLAVCGRWRCACWWPPPFSPWRAAGACVWAGAGTSGKPAARPPWHCRRTSGEENRHTKKGKEKENRMGFRVLSLLSKCYGQENKNCSPWRQPQFFVAHTPSLLNSTPANSTLSCHRGKWWNIQWSKLGMRMGGRSWMDGWRVQV